MAVGNFAQLLGSLSCCQQVGGYSFLESGPCRINAVLRLGLMDDVALNIPSPSHIPHISVIPVHNNR